MFHCRRGALALSILTLLLLALPATTFAADDPLLSVDGISFSSRLELIESEYFKTSGIRCATPDRETRQALYPDDPNDLLGSDCSSSSTNPTDTYEPGDNFQIRTVVHIFMDDACSTGAMTDEQVEGQIQILNEDFMALPNSNGAPGYNGEISFVLATEDPEGNATNGITRHCNTTYFNDGGSYWNEVAWDPNRYMNLYTNLASGNLGYVPFLPANGGGSMVGTPQDRVVVLWDTFGPNGPGGPPYNLGRTATHEVGHYLGLEHTFSGGCGTQTEPGCFSSGDLICDTNGESGPVFRPCAVGDSNTCGSVDPSNNYLDYSDDVCMMAFTQQQIRRMRCSMLTYRTDIYTVATIGPEIFNDDFETGDTSNW